MFKKFYSQLSIRIKVISGSLLALIMMCLFIVIYFPKNIHKQVDSAMESKYHSMAQMISLGVGAGMQSGNFEVIQEALKWARQDSAVIFIDVFDENGNEYASYNPFKIEITKSFVLKNEGILEYNNEQIHIAKIPIIYQDENYGRLILITSLENYIQLTKENTRSLLFATLAIFLFVFVFSYWYGRSITRPLVSLHHSVNELAAGNYDVNIKVKTEDEIGVLANSFSTMAKKIKVLIAQEAMRVSEERFSQMIETAHDIIWTLDIEGNFGYVNNRLEEITGHIASEWVNNQITSLIHADEREKYLKYFTKTLSGTPQNFEIAVTSYTGEEIILAVSSSAIIDNGIAMGTVNFGRDITRQKEAEHTLHNTLNFNKSLLSTFPLAMDVVDEDGNILFVNPVLEKIIGKDKINRKCWEAYRDDKTQCVKCPLKEPFKLNETKSIESTKVLGGRIFEIFHTGMMFKGKRAVMEVFHDITERKKAEADLKAALHKSQEADRLKTAFLANMSHEIRTPMNGILGFARLLKEPNLNEDSKLKFTGIIEKSGTRMLNIINDIIDISKIESGLMEVAIRATNIEEQLEYINALFKNDIKNKGLQLFVKNNLEPNEIVIDTDREKLFAIFTNLVKNAIKYTNSGFIEVGCNKKGEFIVFYVKDTGVGIPQERQSAIFERFIQADIMDKEALQGAGLGLSIAQAYIDMLGGEIWVKSEEGHGSTFYFTVPFDIKSKDEADIKLEAKTDTFEDKIEKLKILIVEDDETSQMLMSILVQKFGESIVEAQNGIEAVEVCRNNPDIDLVLMDIKLPKMNGLEATREIRKFNNDVIIFAQTAFGLSGDMEKAIEAGCNDYIAKPILLKNLEELIYKHFKRQMV